MAILRARRPAPGKPLRITPPEPVASVPTVPGRRDRFQHAFRSGWIDLIDQESRQPWMRARLHPLDPIRIERIVL
jgi:hypothetical protein